MLRRNFLKLAGLGAAGAAIPAFGVLSVSTKDAAVGLVMNELSYLNIDQKEVERFFEDFYKDYNKSGSLYTEVQLRALHLFRVKADRSEMVNLLAKEFLLSSDFFSNKMDMSRPVKYTGLYNPYVSPCANPFSVLYYPPKIS